MPVLKNARHERFAQLVASGRTQADSYREVWPKSKRWKDSSVHVRASLVAAKVSQRVTEIQQASAAKAGITRDELVEFMAQVLRTPIGDVTDKSPISERLRVTPSGIEVFMPSKIAAADFIAKVLGFYAPQKFDGEFRFKPDGPVFDRLRQAAKGK